ncbi:hypothetical protein P8C59_009057 [Phyllachora maydis]|uniref:Major facilitator superfamily (MFS) profile domain-containing protein n=1 Tax=Phyllachora maydis TaxID=1825666 RepID=A0AAD9IDS6_9PEZI|nr:hypothetical protein P8C59_009057 [Phyllachora maydis]
MSDITPTDKQPPSATVLKLPEEALGRKDGIRQHRKCFAACALISLCSFQYGFDFGMIGGLQAMVGFLQVFGHRAPDLPLGWNISTQRQQLISSLMMIGGLVSCLLTGPIAAVAFLGPASGIWTSAGGLVGTIVDNSTEAIDGRQAYMIPMSFMYIIPAIISIGLFFIPESPRWLLQHARGDQARAALRWLRPYGEAELEAEFCDMQDALKAHAEAEKGAAFMDMFKNPVNRRRTALAVCVVLVQNTSGAFYMISYGTYFFANAGLGKPFQDSCITAAVGIVAVLVNSAVITHVGRRRVFLPCGLLLCGLTQLLIAVVYTVDPGTESTGRAIVGLAVIYIFGYYGMIITYSLISAGELPSQQLRSYTFGLATAVGFLGAWVSTFTTPYFINPESLNWGPKYGYLWAPLCVISAAWVYFFLPEVKGRRLEEIDEMFEARLPAKKFRNYVCVGRRGGASSEGKVANVKGK